MLSKVRKREEGLIFNECVCLSNERKGVGQTDRQIVQRFLRFFLDIERIRNKIWREGRMGDEDEKGVLEGKGCWAIGVGSRSRVKRSVTQISHRTCIKTEQ